MWVCWFIYSYHKVARSMQSSRPKFRAIISAGIATTLDRKACVFICLMNDSEIGYEFDCNAESKIG